MKTTRVFILSSQPLFAQGVQSLISAQPGIQVVGTASCEGDAGLASSPDLFSQVQETNPDVVIIETTGAEQGQLVTRVLNAVPNVKVIGLTLEDNRIHTYFQQMKQGHRVEDLLDEIHRPLDWQSRSPETLRLFIVYQGHYGKRILENIRRFAPKTWTVDAWHEPSALPLVVDEPVTFLPLHLPTVDLVLSLAESSSGSQLIPSIVERTGAQAVIAPIDNVSWLPGGLARQLRTQLTAMGVTAVFPKPFCSLTEHSYNVRRHEIAYENPWITEFARHFGRPVFQITCDGQTIAQAQVKRDTACGCARDIARQLVGVDVRDAVIQAGLLQHHYPCLATMRVDPVLGEPLIQAAGDFARQAVEIEIAAQLPQATRLMPDGYDDKQD